MKLRTLFTINIPISAFFGLTCLLVPNGLFALYGVALTPPGVFMTQLAGAAYLGFGVLAYFARSSESKDFQSSLALALFIQDTIGTIVGISGQLMGTFNAFGWTTVALYFLLALGYGYFSFINRKPL
jgi:hypothetical protein